MLYPSQPGSPAARPFEGWILSLCSTPCPPACYPFIPSSVSRMPFQVPSCVTSVFWGPLGSSTVLQGQPTGMLFLVPLLPPSNPACPQVLRCSSSMALTIPNTASALHPASSNCTLTRGPRPPPSLLGITSEPSSSGRTSQLLTGEAILIPHPPSQHPPEAAPFVPPISIHITGVTHTCSMLHLEPSSVSITLLHLLVALLSCCHCPSSKDGSLPPTWVSPPAYAHLPSQIPSRQPLQRYYKCPRGHILSSYLVCMTGPSRPSSPSPASLFSLTLELELVASLVPRAYSDKLFTTF